MANCWEILVNLIRQSAGNLLNYNFLGFFRDYTPEIIFCNCNLFAVPISKSKNDFNFSSYLAGLIEGDGTIHVPKTERSVKNKLNYPSISIVFHLKDLPLCLMIQKNLKHGSIFRVKGSNAYVFTINNIQEQILLVNLINGKMRTPKFMPYII